MPMESHIHINKSPDHTPAILEGSNLNNQALEAERNGDLIAAEQLHLRALELKERHLGPDAVSTALTKNALGELYIKLGKLDEAEGHLKKAVEVRSTAGPAFDAAVSRENLAQLYEMRGRLKEARDTRLLGSPDKMACGYYHCPGQMFRLDQLSQCGKCKAAYYCSASCQAQDWKARHKKYCKAIL